MGGPRRVKIITQHTIRYHTALSYLKNESYIPRFCLLNVKQYNSCLLDYYFLLLRFIRKAHYR